MLRWLGTLGAVVALTIGMGAAPAGTVIAAPASGTLTCGLTGSGLFMPAYPSASSATGSTVDTKFKVMATFGPCNAAGVTGGKATITGGTLVFQAVIPPGGSCADFLTGTPDFSTNPNKLIVKFTSVNGIRHTLIGSNHTDIWGGFQINKGWELDSDDFVLPHGPFGVAESATIDLLFTNLDQVGGCAFGGNAISSVGFSTASGATITIAPDTP